MSGATSGALAGDLFGLLRVLLGRGDGLIPVVDRIVLVVHIVAVGVGDGFAPAVADPAGDRAPRGPTIGTGDAPGSPAGIVRPEVEPGMVVPDLIADFVAPFDAVVAATPGGSRSGRAGWPRGRSPIRAVCTIRASLGTIGAISRHVGAVFDPPRGRTLLAAGS